MSTHGNKDAASNTPLWAASMVNKTPNSTNQTALFGNTTGNAFVTGQTVGVFGVSAAEVSAAKGDITHSGYVIRRVGLGGRAGRVQHEVLVAGGVTTDAENTVFADLSIVLLSQPQDNAVANASAATFRVVAETRPVGGSISYQWQYANGVNVTANSIYSSNTTTANLVVANSAGLNGTSYKVLLVATGATNVTSSNAVLTLTS